MEISMYNMCLDENSTIRYLSWDK